jgi:hypothetical protein
MDIVGKPGRRPLLRPGHRWDSMNIDLKEIEWQDVEQICVAYRTLNGFL